MQMAFLLTKARFAKSYRYEPISGYRHTMRPETVAKMPVKNGKAKLPSRPGATTRRFS